MLPSGTSHFIGDVWTPPHLCWADIFAPDPRGDTFVDGGKRSTTEARRAVSQFGPLRPRRRSTTPVSRRHRSPANGKVSLSAGAN